MQQVIGQAARSRWAGVPSCSGRSDAAPIFTRRAPLRSSRRTLPVRSSAGEPGPQQSTEVSKPEAPSSPPPPNGSNGSNGSSGSNQEGQVVTGEERVRVPREVIDRLKQTVFGVSTFWVTSVENYETEGVLFQGNIRGKDPALIYSRMRERLRQEFGEQYELFLLQDKDDKPTVVLLPKGAGAERIGRGSEIWLAIAFALGTVASTLNASGVPVFQWLVDPFHTQVAQQDLGDAIPYVGSTVALLAAHELGHWQAARKHGVSTYLPFIIPAGFGFIASFGGITRLKDFLPNRAALLEFAAQGPLLGTAVSAALLVVGLVLSSLGVVDIGVESPSFADSLIVAVAAQAVLGDELAQPIVQVNSLLLAGWAGLILNALNCIPFGETDGGRIASALWGRRTGSLLSIWTTAALALSSLGSALAFYWLILVLVLQRGPILPCREEMSEPMDQTQIRYGLAMLALPLLVLLPYPVQLIVALQELTTPGPLPFG